MRTRSLLTLVAGVAALLLAACADGTDAPDGAEPSPSPSPPAATLPTLPPVSPAPPVTPPSPPPAGEVVITGSLIEGVEPGCVVLETDTGGQYLLYGEPVADLPLGGATATVRGEIHPDMATTCQQGTPFEVYEVIERAGR